MPNKFSKESNELWDMEMGDGLFGTIYVTFYDVDCRITDPLRIKWGWFLIFQLQQAVKYIWLFRFGPDNYGCQDLLSARRMIISMDRLASTPLNNHIYLIASFSGKLKPPPFNAENLLLTEEIPVFTGM